MEPELEEMHNGDSIEVEPGLVVERRSFLALAAGALAAFAIPGTALAQMHDRKDELTFEEFLEHVVPVAQELVKDPLVFRGVAADRAIRVAGESGNDAMVGVLETARAPLAEHLVGMGIRLPDRKAKRGSGRERWSRASLDTDSAARAAEPHRRSGQARSVTNSHCTEIWISLPFIVTW